MENKNNGVPILDSSLIFTTINKSYNAKVVMCGDYAQIYIFDDKMIHKKQKDTFDLELKKRKLDNIIENKSIKNNNLTNTIE